MKATSTVNGIDTNSVGTKETRAIIQVWSRNSRNWNGRRNILTNVSMVISTNPPTARAGAASCSINLDSILERGYLAALAKNPTISVIRPPRRSFQPTDAECA